MIKTCLFQWRKKTVLARLGYFLFRLVFQLNHIVI